MWPLAHRTTPLAGGVRLGGQCTQQVPTLGATVQRHRTHSPPRGSAPLKTSQRSSSGGARYSCVHISRLRVTGGFLDGLDVTLTPGLNVIVGARGAGKTSLLELIRHALGLQHADASRDERQVKFVRSILGSGEVILDVEDALESHRLVVDADGGGRRKEFTDLALMLGQNELEAAASKPSARLHLIDLRAETPAVAPVPKEEVTRLTHGLAALRARRVELSDQLRQSAQLAMEIANLEARESELLQRSTTDLVALRRELARVEGDMLSLQKARSDHARRRSALEAVVLNVTQAIQGLNNEALKAGPSREPQRVIVEEARLQVTEVLNRLTALLEEDASQALGLDALEPKLHAEAEPLRRALDEAERGLGELTTQLRRLRAQEQRLETLASELSSAERTYERTLQQRDDLLDAAETQEEQRFQARRVAAAEVSQELDEKVIISVEHLVDVSPFRNYLSDSLQGSGLKYGALADLLARAVLPRQLLGLVEAGDSEGLASIAQTPLERAARVIAHLNEEDKLSRLAAVELSDRADFLLRDGQTVKNVDELSTGQKCAVTLPILMTERDRTLILDQPEDHLDNAYLVDHVVKGLEAREQAHSQTIVATHNPNIPVLGAARRVIVLRSDGRQGRADVVGAFDQPTIVEVITTLMEGGRDAFARRAAFYGV